MQKTRTPILLALSFAALSLTAANTAFASSYIHPSNSEKGYVAVPEHFKSDKTRAQVQAEAAEFVKNGGPVCFRSRNYPPLDTTQASTKTRQQVIDAIGEANQNLPVLVLADDADPSLADGEHGGTRFVAGLTNLLHALHARHGFPEAHP